MCVQSSDGTREYGFSIADVKFCHFSAFLTPASPELALTQHSTTESLSSVYSNLNLETNVAFLVIGYNEIINIAYLKASNVLP